MKNGIAYVRISTKDQSNFSIDGQLAHIQEYCARKDIQLSSTFCDEGRSAKSFDRPDWVKLEDFVKKHHKSIDYLVVCKYDRFSRNAAEGLRMIELLEKKYGIIVLSVFEQMFVDADSPFFFKQRADMLVTAEFELYVIKERIKFGQHQAIKSGRFITLAPFGYKNVKDINGKPNITPIQEQAEIVRQLYNACYMGASITELNTMAKKLGVKRSGNSAIKRILTCPTYAGYLVQPAYKNEPEKVIKGVFEPIIETSIWHHVQQQLSEKRGKVVENEDFPLRGILLCDCGKQFSGAFSKGKNKYYPYYKCAAHKGSNFSATKIHGQFDEMLKLFSVPEPYIDYLVSSARRQLKIGMENQETELRDAKRELKKTAELISSLEEKFLANQINHDTYNRWSMKYSTNKLSLESKVSSLQTDKSAQLADFERLLPQLMNVWELYHGATLGDKKSFVRMVFDNSLSYSGNSFRTPFLLSIFSHNMLRLNEKGLLFYRAKTASLQSVELTGIEPVSKHILQKLSTCLFMH